MLAGLFVPCISILCFSRNVDLAAVEPLGWACLCASSARTGDPAGCPRVAPLLIPTPFFFLSRNISPPILVIFPFFPHRTLFSSRRIPLFSLLPRDIFIEFSLFSHPSPIRVMLSPQNNPSRAIGDAARRRGSHHASPVPCTPRRRMGPGRPPRYI